MRPLTSSYMLRLGLIIFFGAALAASPAAAEPTYRFAIPPAPVSEVLAAFTAVTGVEVRLPALDGIGALPSPGVTGDYTAARALEELLAGTALAARADAADGAGVPGGYTIELQRHAEQVEVTGRAE